MTDTNKSSNTFSVIKTGSKQYIVRSGDKIRIEKIVGEYKAGDTITFDEVLMTSDAGKVTIGNPMVSAAKVMAKISEITRDPTLLVVKYKAKSRYYKKNGHRQPKWIVEIV
jgi:large subunit ribosomal protein L21